MASPSDPDELFSALREREELPSNACNEQIHRTCTGDLKACKAMSARKRSLVSLGILFLVGASLLVLSGRSLSGLTAAALWGAMGWAVVQTVILFLSFARQHKGSGARLRWGLALLVPVAFLGYLTMIRSSTPALATFLGQPESTRHMLHCGAFSFVVGAAVAFGIVLLWRRTDPFTPRLSGSLAGLIGGLGAATPIGLVCPGTDGWHLWLAHGVSLILVVALGAALGRRWLCP